MSNILLAFTVSGESPSPLVATGQPLLGGIMVGAAAALLLSTLGRVAGVSGILGGLLPPPKVGREVEVGFRLAFLTGLVCVGIIAQSIAPESIGNDAPRSILTIAIAGVLVGFGTRLGGGCTSGHGVCGVSRFAPRSMVATTTFIATAVLTLYVMKATGGAP